MAKHSVQIDDSELYQQIVEYCKLNNLKIGSFITELVKKQFMIEMYGDVPFTTYETTIIHSKPISSITEEIVINIPQEILDETMESKEVCKETSHTNTTFLPFELTTSTETNMNKKTLNKYTTPVDSSFYNEIKIEDVNRAAEETQKHTEKPKKRRL